jgi:hypothetical protein
MRFPADIDDREWEQVNLQMWGVSEVTQWNGVQLLPLEAKALHVIGTLVRIFDSVGYLLYCGPENRPYADFYLYAYLIACTAIELLGRCNTGERNKTRSTLKRGLAIVGLETVIVNTWRNGQPSTYTYDANKLSALRNLAAHGQGVASAGGLREDVLLHVELLDSFPAKLMVEFDRYYRELFDSSDPQMRRLLAVAAVEPVLYTKESGRVYVSPIDYAYENIYRPRRKPSQVLKHTDWQVYNPERDRRLRNKSTLHQSGNRDA